MMKTILTPTIDSPTYTITSNLSTIFYRYSVLNWPNRMSFSILFFRFSLFIYLAFMLCYTQDDANAEGGMYSTINLKLN